jgi:hypothetical protein
MVTLGASVLFPIQEEARFIAGVRFWSRPERIASSGLFTSRIQRIRNGILERDTTGTSEPAPSNKLFADQLAVPIAVEFLTNRPLIISLGATYVHAFSRSSKRVTTQINYTAGFTVRVADRLRVEGLAPTFDLASLSNWEISFHYSF